MCLINNIKFSINFRNIFLIKCNKIRLVKLNQTLKETDWTTNSPLVVILRKFEKSQVVAKVH